MIKEVEQLQCLTCSDKSANDDPAASAMSSRDEVYNMMCWNLTEVN